MILYYVIGFVIGSTLPLEILVIKFIISLVTALPKGMVGVVLMGNQPGNKITGFKIVPGKLPVLEPFQYGYVVDTKMPFIVTEVEPITLNSGEKLSFFIELNLNVTLSKPQFEKYLRKMVGLSQDDIQIYYEALLNQIVKMIATQGDILTLVKHDKEKLELSIIEEVEEVNSNLGIEVDSLEIRDLNISKPAAPPEPESEFSFDNFKS